MRPHLSTKLWKQKCNCVIECEAVLIVFSEITDLIEIVKENSNVTVEMEANTKPLSTLQVL